MEQAVDVASGRWFGPGYVYQMTYTADNEIYHHKIGCSRKPTERLGQIQRRENNPNITLYNSVEANEMNRAETAAQKAIEEQLGAVKDPSRGGATDWFIMQEPPENVWPVIKAAVRRHNRVQED